MVDLVQSSNFRLARGPKEGYVRGETFFVLVRNVIASCSDVRLVKEMGDAVFLATSELRPALESVVLIDQVAHQMAAIAGTADFPFSVRSAIGFGTAKRLVRQHDDFLGHPIDRLSRIMGVRSSNASIFLDDEAFRASGEILAEYAPAITISGSIQVPQEITKGMGKNVYYRELLLDRKELVAFEEHFVSWKELGRRGVNG